MTDILGRSARTCPVCDGQGYTKACCTEYRTKREGKRVRLATVKVGSACLKCRGIGRILHINPVQRAKRQLNDQ